MRDAEQQLNDNDATWLAADTRESIELKGVESVPESSSLLLLRKHCAAGFMIGSLATKEQVCPGCRYDFCIVADGVESAQSASSSSM